MKTKEEIIQPVLSWTDLEGDEWEVASKGDILNAMDEYATQQTEALMAERQVLNSEIERLRQRLNDNGLREG